MCGHKARARRCGGANVYRTPALTHISQTTPLVQHNRYYDETDQSTGIASLITAINTLALSKLNTNTNTNNHVNADRTVMNENHGLNLAPKTPQTYPLDLDEKHNPYTDKSTSTSRALPSNPPEYSEHPDTVTPPHPSLSPALNTFTSTLRAYSAGSVSKCVLKRSARNLLNTIYEVEIARREELKGQRLGCKERKGVWRGVKEFKGEVKELVREGKRERRMMM